MHTTVWFCASSRSQCSALVVCTLVLAVLLAPRLANATEGVEEANGEQLNCPTTGSGRASRIGPLGTVEPIGVDICGAARLRSPSAGDGEGGKYVAATVEGAGNTDIVVRRFSSSGVLATGWTVAGRIVFGSVRAQYNPAIAEDGDGGVFVTCQEYGPRTSSDIRIVRLGQDGQVHQGWPQGGILVCDESHDQSSPSIAPDGGGGVWVLWQDRRSSQVELWGVRVTGAASVGQPARLVEGRRGVEITGELVRAAGSTFCVWRAQDVSGGGEIRAGVLSEPPALLDGLLIGSYQGSASNVRVVRTDGAVLCAWVETGGLENRVRAQGLVAAAGLITPTFGTTPVVVGKGQPALESPDIIGIGPSAYVTWSDLRSGDSDVYLQRLMGDGAVYSGWPANGMPVSGASGEQYLPTLSALGNDVLVAWGNEQPVEGLLQQVAESQLNKLSVSMNRFALDWVRVSSSQVALGCTSDRAGQLEFGLYDILGRQIVARAVHFASPGSKEVSAALTRPIPRGIYFARLKGPSGARNTKVVLTK